MSQKVNGPKNFLYLAHLKISEKVGKFGQVFTRSTLEHIFSLNYYEKIEKIHEGALNSSLSVCYEKFSKYKYLFILYTENHKHAIFTSNSDNEVI